ncbi:rod-binding protein [Rosenbergiella australiborealis]|uniref:Peptidoglycan hydrolase n=1 Tax=Rosenbergiella australiborealis TaxID=1544696 RepID=A0ABS5T9D5_9GAMM|nr:rod-binding protein [Rosenbergiella australiborealis]MBT0727573.1 peptidoglycan hydrolase [Rosenbergiella australiborealis]
MKTLLTGTLVTSDTLLPGDIGDQKKPHSLSQAAEQFENQFLRQMIKAMRQATDALVQDSPLDSKQQGLWRDFYDDQLSADLAATHSTGLAEMIVKQLSPATPPSETGHGGRSLSTERQTTDKD